MDSKKPTAESDPIIQEAIEEAVPELDVRPPEFSDDALAEEFSRQHADDLRYVEAWGWLRWDGQRWVKDSTLHVFGMARKVCRAVAVGCEKDYVARKVTAASTVAAVERMARSDSKHLTTVDQFDSDPWVFNTPAGIINLKTGELEPHRRESYCTKIAPVGPSKTPCPLWDKFLNESTRSDQLLQGYLQRLAGYFLTGSTREQKMFFPFGTGGNGKGVLMNTLSGVMGADGEGYATTAAIQTFTEVNNDQHPADLAKLIGARLVVSSETSHERGWNESRIKALTGGDRIAARFMRQNWFDYEPKFKLVISGNYRPTLRNVDPAIRRRLFLIPFAYTVPPDRVDPDLTEKLKEEWPAILQWCIDGCLEWQAIGLQPPPSVLALTDDYMEEEDSFTLWLQEKCEQGPEFITRTSTLFESWQGWCRSAGENAGTQKRFSQKLMSHDFERDRERGERVFKGIRLKSLNMQQIDV